MAQAIKGRRYRHKKGGRYEVLEIGKDTETRAPMVVYRDIDKGDVWVRARDRFEDEGRFVFRGPAAAAEPPRGRCPTCRNTGSYSRGGDGPNCPTCGGS